MKSFMKSLLSSCGGLLSIAVLVFLSIITAPKSRFAECTRLRPQHNNTKWNQPAANQPQTERLPHIMREDIQHLTGALPVIDHVKTTSAEANDSAGHVETRSRMAVRGRPQVWSAITRQLASDIASFSRRNPVVEAVAKTKAGVVAIRVARSGEKDMIGTGFIVDESGLIVTNLHVTGGKAFLKVRLHDGTDLWGKVIASDKDWDLAVIRVDAASHLNLQALTLAPTTDLMLAETVIAIGNPYGYEGTVSVGNISAINREITMPNDVTITGLIQTTAPINPGNSGGPLVNINGEVIGINVALRDGAQNIAFAINAGAVKSFLHQHFNARQVSSIDHGVAYEEQVLGEVGDRQRVVVTHAEHDELKSGDVILMVGTRKVVSAFDMERAIWQKKPGEQVVIKILRQGREINVTMRLGGKQGAGAVAAVTTEAPVHNRSATINVRSANQR